MNEFPIIPRVNSFLRTSEVETHLLYDFMLEERTLISLEFDLWSPSKDYFLLRTQIHKYITFLVFENNKIIL